MISYIHLKFGGMMHSPTKHIPDSKGHGANI